MTVEWLVVIWLRLTNEINEQVDTLQVTITQENLALCMPLKFGFFGKPAGRLLRIALFNFESTLETRDYEYESKAQLKPFQHSLPKVWNYLS